MGSWRPGSSPRGIHAEWGCGTNIGAVNFDIVSASLLLSAPEGSDYHNNSVKDDTDLWARDEEELSRCK